MTCCVCLVCINSFELHNDLTTIHGPLMLRAPKTLKQFVFHLYCLTFYKFLRYLLWSMSNKYSFNFISPNYISWENVLQWSFLFWVVLLKLAFSLNLRCLFAFTSKRQVCQIILISGVHKLECLIKSISVSNISISNIPIK